MHEGLLMKQVRETVQNMKADIPAAATAQKPPALKPNRCTTS
jgi:hypothetical protein